MNTVVLKKAVERGRLMGSVVENTVGWKVYKAVKWRGRGLLVPQSCLCSSTAFYIIYCCKVLSYR